MSAHDHPRFWTPHLAPGPVTLEESQAHHALHVLRLKVGDAVELFDGRGARARGHIAPAGRREAVVDVQEMLPPAPAPKPAVHLAFAVPKGKRLDWLLEKATELGAASLQGVLFQRSIAGGEELSDAKSRRWLDHCIAAARQCELDRLPELRPMIALADLLAAAPGALRLLGDPAPAAAGIFDALPATPPDDVVILVGPEGALTDEESARAVAAGFVPVRLGRTILRVETAAMALVAAAAARYS
ncbi:MAG: RsmE family RNA methyltransferase [Planctomycetota bacterium]|nr:RsmE family RNA methyltransferase [Planctomycetota bacterium]